MAKQNNDSNHTNELLSFLSKFDNFNNCIETVVPKSKLAERIKAYRQFIIAIDTSGP